MDPLRELIAALEAAREALDAAGAENARLRQRVAVLEQALAVSQRAGKRQAAPFSKGPPLVIPRSPDAGLVPSMAPTDTGRFLITSTR